MHTSPRTTPLIIILLFASLILGACGDSGDENGSAAASAKDTSGPPLLEDSADNKGGVPGVDEICAILTNTLGGDSDDGNPCNQTGWEEFKETCESSSCVGCSIGCVACVLSGGLACAGCAAACVECGAFLKKIYEDEDNDACLCNLGVNACASGEKGTWDAVKNECNCECDPARCDSYCGGLTEPCASGGGCFARTNPPPPPQGQNECKCTEILEGAECSSDDQCDGGAVCCEASINGACQCQSDNNCGGTPGENPGADMCLFAGNNYGCCRCLSDLNSDGEPDTCTCSPSQDSCLGEYHKTSRCVPQTGNSCPDASTGTCLFDPGTGVTVAGCMVACQSCGVQGCGGCGGATGQDQNCGGDLPTREEECACTTLEHVGNQHCIVEAGRAPMDPGYNFIEVCQKKDTGETCGGVFGGDCEAPSICGEDGICYILGWNLFGPTAGGLIECGENTCVDDPSSCRSECVDIATPPSGDCSPSNCQGCCNQWGFCEAGTTVDACGLGGTACVDCGVDDLDVCISGHCNPPPGGEGEGEGEGEGDCTMGESEPCACDNGTAGAKTCDENGVFGECMCGGGEGEGEGEMPGGP